MLGRAHGAVLEGAEACLVSVEVDLSGGLPAIAAVGLPDSAVREGIDRIRAALRHGGFHLPMRRITLNLAPASTRKTGTALDLPIALAILAADGQVAWERGEATVFAGELALDGALRGIRGILATALAARRAGHARLVVPAANAEEAALVAGIDVYGAATLAEAAGLAAGRLETTPVRLDLEAALRKAQEEPRAPLPDLGEVRGQAAARRALEIAAAGGHHLLLTGPPGCGKTMLAERMAGILPPMTLEEALEVTRVWSAEGLANGLVGRRPYRAPHHGVTPAGLVGGGSPLRAGEAALASGGVLFLDELPEFRREALEMLRQPLESGRIALRRLRAGIVYPARFTLVASMNPCPCGHAGQPGGRCRCGPGEIRRYLGRLSGPLLDRFDLVVSLRAVRFEEIEGAVGGEPSARVRARVVEARARQQRRFGPDGPSCNARMSRDHLDRFVALRPAGRDLLREASARMGFSARGHDRIRRVARTIADLEGVDAVDVPHLAEAILYRPPVEPESGTGGLHPPGVPRKE
jgi:magnesium chelatase family protein